MLSDPVLLAIVMAVPPTLAGLAALIVSIQTKTKTEKVIQHVNGTTSKMLEDNKALRKEIESLLEQRAERKQDAALLAQSVVEQNKNSDERS